MRRILVVEDDVAVTELLAINLRQAGFTVASAATAARAKSALDGVLPNLVVLDWMLPGGTGIELVTRWRSQSRTRGLPIIMLTGRCEEADIVAALDAGADDYLAKPFSPKELLARITSLLRRRAPEALNTDITIGPLTIKPATGFARAYGNEVRLNPIELELLHVLMAYPGRTFARRVLLDRVWGDHVFIEERTVDVHVKRLRAALDALDCASMIETLRGSGYRLSESLPLRRRETSS